jgi:hypothetical protein
MQLQLRGNLVLTPWNDTGNTDFDAAANAILGAYIGSLGLSESAIFFMTVKGKDEDKFLYLEPPEVREPLWIEAVSPSPGGAVGGDRAGP